jgi:hypothetical protein
MDANKLPTNCLISSLPQRCFFNPLLGKGLTTGQEKNTNWMDPGGKLVRVRALCTNKK